MELDFDKIELRMDFFFFLKKKMRKANSTQSTMVEFSHNSNLEIELYAEFDFQKIEFENKNIS